jgi:hypothetical protein
MDPQVRTAMGCGISHKNAQHTDKYNKTHTQIHIQNIVKISPKIKVSHKIYKCYAKSIHM